MSQQVNVQRALNLQRGGSKGNMASPVILMTCQNKSGGALARGDVVVWDKTSNSTPDVIAVTTTTSQNSVDVFGMVYDASIANSAFGKVQIWGPTDALKVDGTTDIAIGDLIGTFTTAKIGSKTTAGGAFARAQEAYSTNDSSGVINAFIQCMQGPLPGSSVSTLADSASLTFGDSSDVTMAWDGTDFDITAAAANSMFNIGSATAAFDVSIFGSGAAAYISWDASADDLKFEDSVSLMFGTGAGAGVGNAGDVEIRWDGTDLDILAAANNTILKIGNGTNSFDIWIYGSAAGNYISFDASANDLKFEDSVSLMFGTGAGAGPGTAGDVEIRWDGTDLDILAAADDSIIKIGTGTNSFDLWLFGNTANTYISWDASADDLKFEDSVSLMFGTGAGAGPGNAGDVEIRWDGTDLDILAAANNSIIKIGDGTTSFDLWLFGSAAGNYVSWDASANDLKLEDSVSLMFGTGAGAGPGTAGDIEIRWDGTDLDVLAAADDLVIKLGNGTNSFDVWVYGNTASDYIQFDASANTLALAGAVYLVPSAIADPGNAGAIPVTVSGYVPLVTGGAETRTLAAPGYIGQELLLYAKTLVGNCVVTCATTFNETGNNTITYSATGQAVRMIAVEEGANKRWRCATADGASLSTV